MKQVINLDAFDEAYSLIEQAAACLMDVQVLDEESGAAESRNGLITLTSALAEQAEEAHEVGLTATSAQWCRDGVTALQRAVFWFCGDEGRTDTLSFAAHSLLLLAEMKLTQEVERLQEQPTPGHVKPTPKPAAPAKKPREEVPA